MARDVIASVAKTTKSVARFPGSTNYKAYKHLNVIFHIKGCCKAFVQVLGIANQKILRYFALFSHGTPVDLHGSAEVGIFQTQKLLNNDNLSLSTLFEQISNVIHFQG